MTSKDSPSLPSATLSVQLPRPTTQILVKCRRGIAGKQSVGHVGTIQDKTILNKTTDRKQQCIAASTDVFSAVCVWQVRRETVSAVHAV